MNAAIRVLLSCIVLIVLFEGMVTAFHLLNLPSNLAVLEGTCLLLLVAAAAFWSFRRIWNRRWVDGG